MKFVQASKLAFSTHTILCSSPDIFFVFVTFKTIQYLSRPLNLFHSEILMLQGLLSCDSLLRRYLQETIDEVQGLVWGLGNCFPQRSCFELRHLKRHLSSQSISLRPFFFGWSSHQLQYSHKLIFFSGSWEERVASVQFSHDGSKCEEVHGRVIVPASQQSFWGSVPSCGDILSERRFGSDLSGQSEICNFDSTVDFQQIFWFHVSVEIPFPMHISECLQGLKDDVPHLVVREFSFLLQQLIDISLQVFKDEVELIILFDQFEQLYDVGMMQFSEDPDFVQVDTLLPFLVFVLHFFDGHKLTGLLVEGFGDSPE